MSVQVELLILVTLLSVVDRRSSLAPSSGLTPAIDAVGTSETSARQHGVTNLKTFTLNICKLLSHTLDTFVWCAEI